MAAGPAGGEIAEFVAVLLLGVGGFGSTIIDEAPLLLAAEGIKEGRDSTRGCSDGADL